MRQILDSTGLDHQKVQVFHHFSFCIVFTASIYEIAISTVLASPLVSRNRPLDRPVDLIRPTASE